MIQFQSKEEAVTLNAVSCFHESSFQFYQRWIKDHLMVTSSSPAVGWIATVLSKSFFVAPIFTATAKPCRISSHPIPIMCKPKTLTKEQTLQHGRECWEKSTLKPLNVCFHSGGQISHLHSTLHPLYSIWAVSNYWGTKFSSQLSWLNDNFQMRNKKAIQQKNRLYTSNSVYTAMKFNSYIFC